MQDVSSILGNDLLWVSLIACLLAQGLKFVIELVREGKFDARSLFTTGGMPSAHSALVASLATGVGIKEGWDSTSFAIALLFAIIVMYDAAGVRQAAGKQARLLNQIVDEFFSEKQEFNEEKLKELLGHTPLQVVVGFILGIIIAVLAYFPLS
ncbi:divergent PAP2 family protein [Euhalothece natronophila Z-M001]|uniref:Divergent PAP2 family protein n=1 Tax=Euhalothece natronophila Z-M001 TaxID=522448 RepID=A0A5B8NSY9_9CHRO|nr:divergent PAP2 family protein [Euhalothece natronophila]QDZ41489.1 divergent PAP2 family protein [Euhalothece natronophila Z-M001]